MTEALADTGTGQQQFSGKINAARQQTPTQHNLSSPGHQHKTKCIINVLTLLLECFTLHTHSSLHDATMTSVAQYAAESDGCDGEPVFGAQSECKLFSAITIILPRQYLSDPLVKACGARISGNTLYCRHKRNHSFTERADISALCSEEYRRRRRGVGREAAELLVSVPRAAVHRLQCTSQVIQKQRRCFYF